MSLSLRALIEKDYQVIVYSSKGSGFLSEVPGVDFRPLMYRWTSNKLSLLFLFIATQIQIFFIILIKYSNKKDQIFYINTILPLGAALAGRLLKKKIVYHIHEHYIHPNLIQRLSLWIMQITASKVIFVSSYLKSETEVNRPFAVVHNVLSPEFCKISEDFLNEFKILQKTPLKNILMVSSLKIYKGIFILIDLANKMPEYEFTLVASATQSEVNDFIKQHPITDNLIIIPVKSNLHSFYQKAGVLVNLTIPDLCIETFGMTILEGMKYGLPIIGPPVGGPLELIRDGINGYVIDSRDTEQIIIAIKKIFDQEELYHSFSEASVQLAKKYKYLDFADQIIEVINF